ncbi:MAG: nucleotidyltransferase [Deltaproteobacteria bacterium]|nr:nucleotidyltransferase [Deltaproteobacteria bacterium]
MNEAWRLEDFTKTLEESDIRYMLIGGQAVTLYGSPLASFDFDFWVDSTQRKDFLRIADEMGFEYDDTTAVVKPLVVFYAEEEKIDVFFVKKMTTLAGSSVDFQECYKRAVLLKDVSGLSVRVPGIDDLISLKTCKKKPSAKDAEDIEYLEIIKKRLRKKS